MRRLGALFAIGLLALLAGCGYRVVGYAPRAGESPLSVSIQTLDNDSLEPGIELMVSDALRRRFLRAGRIVLIERSARADYAIRGRVIAVTTQSRSFSSSARALEFTVTLRIQLEVSGGDGRQLGLDPFALAESEIYLVSSDIEVSRKNREEALRRLAGLLAGRVYDEIELLTSEARLGPPGARTRKSA